ARAPRARTGLSVAAMVVGIVSILGALVIPLLGVICAILAMIFGIIGLRQARAGSSNRRGFALTGLITGVIGLVLAIVVAVFAARKYYACQHHIRHRPSREELQQSNQESV